MEREQVRRWEAQCIQEQPPACSATCPIHVDARQLVDHVRTGNFQQGLAVLSAATPLAPILAFVCDHPCQLQCRRRDAGDAIEIGLLEKACAQFGGTPPALRPLGTRDRRVAIIGGGLSGLSAAANLASRGYEVGLFEKQPRLLERIRALGEAVLPARVIDSTLEHFESLSIAMHCEGFISRHPGPFGLDSLIHEFDAVLLAAGPEVFDEDALGLARTPEGRLQIDPLTLATSAPRVFAAGSQRYAPAAYSPIASVSDGIYAAISIDRFLQGASLTANRDNQGPYPSRLFVNTPEFAPASALQPATNNAFSREEAMAEAARCFPCNCLECVKVCQYLQDYGSYPKRYVRQIYNNECIVMGVRKANRMVNSCALCGLCASVCPEHLSMADVCLDARQSMVRTGKMPASAHDFALRDMAFSQSDAFALARHQPGFDTSAFALLPGCQLSASSSQHVISAYEHLRNALPGGVGLVLECCGAPARWAGNEDKFHHALQRIQSAWSSLGNPKLITACSSCYKTLCDHLPQIPVEPLWPHLSSVAPALSPFARKDYALHDPCSTRGNSVVEGSARNLLHSIGVEPRELNAPGLTTCCGYGGLQLFVNPDLADKTVARRASENDADYITYCAMCRDRFAHLGKRTVHILDLVFPSDSADPASRPDPGFSQRHDNRAALKTELLRTVWGEREAAMETPLRLQVSPELHRTLESRMIIDGDLRRTIAHAETTSDKLEDPATGRFLASLRSGCVTYWVEYIQQGDEFLVTDAYSHRMEVR